MRTPLYIALMLDRTPTNNAVSGSAQVTGTEDFAPFDIVEGSLKRGLILVCDHARNALPEKYGSLGLPQEQLARHIGFDIGVEEVTRKLAERLDVPAAFALYSRLLIDPNRGADDPTLVMRLSDGAVVPGNADIDEDEIEHRKQTYYFPYHRALKALIDDALAEGIIPAILSIHSFTPAWKGVPRPWHAGVLWDNDGRFATPLISALQHDKSLVVGDNEPYTGQLEGDTMNTHGTQRGLAHALIEIRQDLIADDAGIAEWTDRLAEVLPPIVAAPELHEQKHFS
ncbi:MAG: N-formylglutamate amidohydrolase [Hyphomicrobiales bacterium]